MVNNDNSKLAYYGGPQSVESKLIYEWPIITEYDVNYVSDILKRGEISFNYIDTEIRKLEDGFKKIVGSKHVLAVNSGTSALYLAFKALNLRADDFVAVPTYTFPATIMPLITMGVNIVFIDTEIGSTRMCVQDLKAKLTDKFRCIVVAHLDGIPGNINEICEIAREFNCYIIEDCAQALGSCVNNKYLGTFGDIGIYSLQQKKLIASGEGGILVTNNKYIYEQAILMSYLQKRSYEEVSIVELAKYNYTGLGHNFRIHPLSAALASCQISRFDEILSRRTKDLNIIANNLNNLFGVRVMREKEGEVNSYYSLKFIYDKENEIPVEMYVDWIKHEGILLEKALTKPLHLELSYLSGNENDNYFKSKFEFNNLPNSEKISKYILRMPPYYDLNEDVRNQIISGFIKVSNHMRSISMTI